MMYPTISDTCLHHLATAAEHSMMVSTYGCNSIHKEMDVSVLVCMDVWYQFEVIASGYPADHECLFGDWNPMPVGVKPEDLNPPNYDLYEYNPEDRRTADSWCYYATSAADYEKARPRDMQCLTGNLTVVMSAG